MKDLKFYAGTLLIVLSCAMPFFGFWVASSHLPLAVKGATIGLLTVGGPEIAAILAVALLGKETFDFLTGQMVRHLNRLAPHGSVSRTRYRIGIVLCLVTFIPNYVMGYAPHLLPDSSPARLYVNIAADLLFVLSLFVLGGDFWDKLRSLFLYDAKAHFPIKTVES